MRVLVTRPEPDASRLAEEIRALGQEPVLQPLLKFHALKAEPAAFQGADAVAVTSGNGLRALQEMGKFQDLLHLPLFCTGKETADKARALGFRNIMAVAQTAGELAEHIAKSAGALRSIIHISGMHQAFDLEAALENHGISVRTLNVYSMEARQELDSATVRALKDGCVDSVTLMSARTASVFVSLCQKHEIQDYVTSLLYLCLSEGVAARLRPLEANNIRVAEKPTRQALLDLLAAIIV
jgi:uroporphyrinogen-III synthase